MFPPVAIGQARLVSADLKLAGGFCLPAGTAALVPHHAMHSASFNWDKPNEFLPGSSPPTQSMPLSLGYVQPENCALYSTMPHRAQPSIEKFPASLPKVLLLCVSLCMQVCSFVFCILPFEHTQLLMHWLPASVCLTQGLWLKGLSGFSIGLAERWLVPGAEYAVSKKQQMANGDRSADDAHASSAALLEDAEGLGSLLRLLIVLPESCMPFCSTKFLPQSIAHHLWCTS